MLDAVLDLALPRLCVGCRTPDRHALCPRCRPLAPPLVSASPGFPVAAAGNYDGALRTALLAYKERGRRDLAAALGRVLADAVRARDPGPDVALVPVPSSRRARRSRGGDHVLRLARVVTRTTGLPVRTPLHLVRTVRDSAGLDATHRQTNLSGAMGATCTGRFRRAIVLDDIATTGATLTEAARALADAGWHVAGAAVIAATAKRDGLDRWRDPVHGSSVGMT
jgi:predicted amidophosphoribosyltransferase